MNVIEVNNHEIEGEMSYQEIGFTVDKATIDFGAILAMCLDCSRVTPVDEAKWELLSGRYEYYMKMVDGREWTQTVRLDGKEIWLTSVFAKEFSGAEVQRIVKMRVALAKLSAKYKVVRVDLNWL